MRISHLLGSFALVSLFAADLAAQEKKPPTAREKALAEQVRILTGKLKKESQRAVLQKLLEGRRVRPRLGRRLGDARLLPLPRNGFPLQIRPGVRITVNPGPTGRVSELQQAKAKVAAASQRLTRARSLEAIKQATDALELATIELRRVVWKLKRKQGKAAKK